MVIFCSPHFYCKHIVVTYCFVVTGAIIAFIATQTLNHWLELLMVFWILKELLTKFDGVDCFIVYGLSVFVKIFFFVEIILI